MADTADVDVELADRNPKMNESYTESVSTVHDEPARSDFIGMRFAEDDPAVSSMGHGDSQTDLGIEERRGGYGNDVGQRLACPPVGCSSTDGKPVYSNPRYSGPQKSNLRRLPSLDRLPSRAASNSTVNAPSVNASTAELVDGKAAKPKDDNSPKAKIVEFFNNPKYEKPRALALIILLIIVLILIIVLPIVLSRRPEEDKKEEPKVYKPMAQITCAWLEGVHEKNISVFKGIPYALSPDGRNRWKPPRELTDGVTCKMKFPNNTQTTVTRADKFGARCYQRIKNGYMGGDEDCLTLNVWTPTNKTDAGLPVIVYIHGGQLSFGGGDEIASYGVHNLVKEYDLIVVSMNYRLGPFGFMTLKEFPDFQNNKTSGNYGLMDQIAALKWVKENIKNFGGDPTKVTLLGWESGGTSVLALLNSEKAVHLFHHAWVMDAGFIKDQTLADTHTANAKFLSNSGCSNSGTADMIMNCLYEKSAKLITEAVPWLDGNKWTLPQMYDVPTKDDFMAAIITVDGLVVKNSTSGMYNTRVVESKVPLVIGNGEDASDLDPPYFEKGKFPYLTTAQLVAMEDKLAAFSRTLRTLPTEYEKLAVNHEHAYMMMISDMRARCPMNEVARMVSQVVSQPVYRYIFKTKPSQRIDALGRGFWAKYSFRGIDMLAIFGAFDDYYSFYFKGKENFQKSMQKNLAEFALKGKVSGWSYLPNDYVVVDSTSAVTHPITDTTTYKDCKLFTDAGIDMKYAWMN